MTGGDTTPGRKFAGERPRLWFLAPWLDNCAHGISRQYAGLAKLIDCKTGGSVPIVASSPVVTQLLAWVVDREIPARRTVLGGTVAVGGVNALIVVGLPEQLRP